MGENMTATEVRLRQKLFEPRIRRLELTAQLCLLEIVRIASEHLAEIIDDRPGRG